MSKEIKERRANSANVPESKRAVIVDRDGVATKKRGSFWGGFVLAVALVIAVVALVIFIINSVVNSYYSKVDGVQYNEKDIIADIPDKISSSNMFLYDDSVVKNDAYHVIRDNALLNFAEASCSIKEDENVYNYVILGVDKLDETAGEAQADVVLIASINKATNKVTYATIEARALAYIPVVNKIGALKDAYEWGGAALLAKTVSYNYGIGINGYIELNMSGCAAIVDAVGGITLELSDADIAAANESVKAIKSVFSGFEVSEIAKGDDGKVKLDGNQTLAYIRGTKESRSTAITNILKEASMGAFKKGFGGVKAYLNAISDNAKTSANKSDFVNIFRLVFSSAKKTNVETLSVGESTLTRTKVTDKAQYAYSFDYAKERAALVTALYGEQK